MDYTSLKERMEKTINSFNEKLFVHSTYSNSRSNKKKI